MNLTYVIPLDTYCPTSRIRAYRFYNGTRYNDSYIARKEIPNSSWYRAVDETPYEKSVRVSSKYLPFYICTYARPRYNLYICCLLFD